MNIHIIRTDGREERHAISRALAMNTIRRLIDAKMLDTVNLRDGRVMLVDDAGYEITVVDKGLQPMGAGATLAQTYKNEPVRARKPVNEKATTLYHGVCRPGTTHQIVGDVAIVVDAEFG